MKLTKLELEVMDAIWEAGCASVREVQERLPETKRAAYTTVQTIVYRLEVKGALRRLKKIGNAYIFEPVISRQSVHKRLINDLLDLLGGSTRPLMAHLIESGQLTLESVRELENTLAKIENEEPKPAAKKKRGKTARRNR